MIIQPEQKIRCINNSFYEAEKIRINLLNREFFYNVELTDEENAALVWLCGWDESIIDNIVSAFKKV